MIVLFLYECFHFRSTEKKQLKPPTTKALRKKTHIRRAATALCVWFSFTFLLFFQSSKPKSQFHISECNMRTFQLHLYFQMNHKVSVTVVYTHSIYFCRVLMVYVLCTPTSALNAFFCRYSFISRIFAGKACSLVVVSDYIAVDGTIVIDTTVSYLFLKWRFITIFLDHYAI